eukprot:5399372-Pyramimonas_sp.AAC.1
MVMQSAGRLLRFDGSEESVDAASDASHRFCRTARGILTRPRGSRAARAIRAHPRAKHRSQNGSNLHEERVGCGQRIFREQ